MVVLFSRALGTALVGAVAGVASLVAVFASNPTLTLNMDHERLAILTGFSEPEMDGATTFAWTKGRADVALADLNRASPWRCTVRLRGARPPGIAQPTVDLAVDGVTVATVTATNEYQDASVVVSESPRAGARLTIASAPTFKAPPDPREFGVQVDSVICRPATSALAWPSAAATREAGVAGATWGAAIGLAGLSAGASIAITAAVVAAQAFPLAAGAAPYTQHAARAAWLAVWIAACLLAANAGLRLGRRQPLSSAAKFVLVFSAAVLYLKLLALLHPGKLIVDGLFHAHNLSKVIAGAPFFVQTIGHVRFPYAVALYVFAAPWAVFTHTDADRIALLRIVVCASDVVAGGFLYWMVVRVWGNRLAGVIAVVLYQVLPLSFGIQGNANLTHGFGQSVALIAVAVVTTWPLDERRLRQAAAAGLIIAAAFLSHIAVLVVLLGTLLVLAVLHWWAGPPLRARVWPVCVAVLIAVMLAGVLYYGRWDHFGDAYLSARDARNAVAGTAGVVPAPSMPLRALAALGSLASGLGWGIGGLALLGIWRVSAEGRRDRLVLTLAAWGIALAVFLAFGVIAPGSGSWRQAMEFMSRAVYESAPAAIILAAVGYEWAWRAGIATRLLAMGLLAGAGAISAPYWFGWFQ
jgi:hypothetical protein